MPETTPPQAFGIHQATFRSLADDSMATAYILGDGIPDFNQELVENRGGSTPFAHDAAPGETAGEIALTVKQYSAGIFKFFTPYEAGASIIENASGEAAGDVSAILNNIGVSVVDAVTGIASIAADVAGTLRLGDYIVKAATTDSIDIYVDNNIDGQLFVDDTCKLTDTPVTIPGTDGTVNSNGITFTGGSGVIALVVGETARFQVRPINAYSLQNIIGSPAACMQKFALTLVSEAQCNGTRIMRVTNYPRCIASGNGVITFPYKNFATFETTIKALYSIENGYVAKQTVINR